MLVNVGLSYVFVLCLTWTSKVCGSYAIHHNTQYCPRLTEIDAVKNPTGEIKSPLYGQGNYVTQLSCFWHINVPRDWRIKITFKDFDITESYFCRSHYVDFYGEGGSDQIAVLCGSDIPRPVFSRKGDNVLRIHFSSAGDIETGRGFHMHYEAGPDIEECPADHMVCKNRNCVPESKKCDGIDDCGDGTDEEGCVTDEVDPNLKYCPSQVDIDAVKNPTGEIKSPLYGEENYLEGLSCYYHINIPRNWRLKIIFKDLDIIASDHCGYHYIDFYGEGGSDVIGVFCGSDIPRPIFSTKGDNVVRIHFSSREGFGAGRGFHIYYEAGPDIEECPANHIICRNRKCVPNSKKCDGIDDCEDGTDEQKCGYPVITAEECGNPAIKPNTVDQSPDRIVGGEEVIPHSWPWQVSLNRYYVDPTAHFCGGTLINSQWVITAKHCFGGNGDPAPYSIRLGMHSKYVKESGEEVRYPERIIAYPDLEFQDFMKRPGFDDDITLIKLNAPVNFTKTIQPACLPPMDFSMPIGTTCYATGWGQTRGSGSNHALKQALQVVQSTTDCSYDPKHQICVKHPENFHSPCHGDSGGPLACNFDGKWFVMGDLSYASHGNEMGQGLCGMPGTAVIYSKVSDKIDWINLIVSKFS